MLLLLSFLSIIILAIATIIITISKNDNSSVILWEQWQLIILILIVRVTIYYRYCYNHCHYSIILLNYSTYHKFILVYLIISNYHWDLSIILLAQWRCMWHLYRNLLSLTTLAYCFCTYTCMKMCIYIYRERGGMEKNG